MLRKYDCIVVLSSQPDYRNWMFPSHTYKSLDRAAELLREEVAPWVALTGDHALKFDWVGITQPFKESDQAEQYLLDQGTPSEVILKEGKSRDTLSNFYYLKRLVFRPHSIHDVLLVSPEFRIQRLNFLARKVLGPDYSIDYELVPNAPEETYIHEDRTLRKQRELLADMKDGDDAWLNGRFFGDPMYDYWKADTMKVSDPVKRALI